jgi:hypothetical protein
MVLKVKEGGLCGFEVQREKEGKVDLFPLLELLVQPQTVLP